MPLARASAARNSASSLSISPLRMSSKWAAVGSARSAARKVWNFTASAPASAAARIMAAAVSRLPPWLKPTSATSSGRPVRWRLRKSISILPVAHRSKT